MFKYFTFGNRSEYQFEKFIQNSSLLNNTPLLDLMDLLQLIETFEGKSQYTKKNGGGKNNKPNVKKLIQLQFSLLRSQKDENVLLKFKSLLTIHLVLNEFQVGIMFAELFLDQDHNWVYSTQVGNLSDLLKNYLGYIQRLASNVHIYHSCKIFQYPIQYENQSSDFDSKVLWLFKINNLLQNLLNQSFKIKESILIYRNLNVLQEIMLIFWSDILVLYNFLSMKLMQFLDSFRSIPGNFCYQYNELVHEQIKINDNVQKIFLFRDLFDQDKVVKAPKVFQVKKLLLDQIKSYILTEKLQEGPLSSRIRIKEKVIVNTKESSNQLPDEKTKSCSKGQLTDRLNYRDSVLEDFQNLRGQYTTRKR